MVGYSYRAADYPIANSQSITFNSSGYGYTLDKPSPQSDWQCYLFGDADRPGPGAVVFVPVKGREPNWFHRKMQELCFGIKWRKRK